MFIALIFFILATLVLVAANLIERKNNQRLQRSLADKDRRIENLVSHKKKLFGALHKSKNQCRRQDNQIKELEERNFVLKYELDLAIERLTDHIGRIAYLRNQVTAGHQLLEMALTGVHPDLKERMKHRSTHPTLFAL